MGLRLGVRRVRRWMRSWSPRWLTASHRRWRCILYMKERLERRKIEGNSGAGVLDRLRFWMERTARMSLLTCRQSMSLKARPDRSNSRNVAFLEFAAIKLRIKSCIPLTGKAESFTEGVKTRIKGVGYSSFSYHLMILILILIKHAWEALGLGLSWEPIQLSLALATLAVFYVLKWSVSNRHLF